MVPVVFVLVEGGGEGLERCKFCDDTIWLVVDFRLMDGKSDDPSCSGLDRQ